MEALTQLIKKNIKLRYSSTKRFSEAIGVPHTTIVSAIKNGISGTSFSTVCKICQALDIRIVNGIYPATVSETTTKLLSKISQLDEKGIHTVSTVLEMEYLRCLAENENIELAQRNAATENLKNYSYFRNNDIPSKNDITSLLIALNEESMK